MKVNSIFNLHVLRSQDVTAIMSLPFLGSTGKLTNYYDQVAVHKYYESATRLPSLLMLNVIIQVFKVHGSRFKDN